MRTCINAFFSPSNQFFGHTGHKKRITGLQQSVSSSSNKVSHLVPSSHNKCLAAFHHNHLRLLVTCVGQFSRRLSWSLVVWSPICSPSLKESSDVFQQIKHIYVVPYGSGVADFSSWVTAFSFFSVSFWLDVSITSHTLAAQVCSQLTSQSCSRGD